MMSGTVFAACLITFLTVLSYPSLGQVTVSQSCSHIPNSHWNGTECVCHDKYYMDDSGSGCEMCSTCCDDADLVQSCVDQGLTTMRCRNDSCSMEIPTNATTAVPTEAPKSGGGVEVWVIVLIVLIIVAVLVVIAIGCYLKRFRGGRTRVPTSEH